ncbi:MAG: hypothetical protein GF372_13800 [Candidatus Marinimicrobia bacterium]|nr:hypothetical protein [Candidatus Neomarinimicrobiota bacterium]
MSDKVQDVDRYLEGLTDKHKADLSAIRILIYETIPDVVETMQNGMPTYQYRGKIIVSYTSNGQYMSIYFNNHELFETYEDSFKHLNSAEGIIRFHDIEDVPITQVKKILAESIED